MGTAVRVTISGASGGVWLVVRGDGGWALYEDEPIVPSAHVTIDEVDAWKVFTKSINRTDVEARVVIEGDRELGSKVLNTVSIIA